MTCEFLSEDIWTHNLDEKETETIIPHDSAIVKYSEPLDQYVTNANVIIVCIDDILQTDIGNMSSFEILRNQCHVAYFIQQIYQQMPDKIYMFSKETLVNIYGYFEYLSKCSSILAERIGQTPLLYRTNHNRKPYIIRSSYSFCNKYTQCRNFYCKITCPTCTDHHFVHNILKHDIDSVMAFLKYMIERNATFTEEDERNFLLSIRTICFVTRHMANEIADIHSLTDKKSENFHRNNPCKIFKNTVPRKIENCRNNSKRVHNSYQLLSQI